MGSHFCSAFQPINPLNARTFQNQGAYLVIAQSVLVGSLFNLGAKLRRPIENLLPQIQLLEKDHPNIYHSF